jgi:hypothetical protein
MKEVTEDSDVLKGSVFHRLIQRAFPGWFPYDSVRFFHPFYTGAKNAQFAREQGKEKDLNMSVSKKNGQYVYDFKSSDPKTPNKPIVLTTYEDIKIFLDNPTDDFVHPARVHLEGLPLPIQDILNPNKKSTATKGDAGIGDAKLLIDYITDLTYDMIKRENITVDSGRTRPTGPVHQIDITREYVYIATTYDAKLFIN